MIYIHRYVCEVLQEMRDNIKVYKDVDSIDDINMTMFKGSQRHMRAMVEEVQTLVNRMEAALGDNKDYNKLHKKASKLKKEIAQLKEDKESLTKEGKEEPEAIISARPGETASDFIDRVNEDNLDGEAGSWLY